MTNQTTPQQEKASDARTEAEARSIDGRAGKDNKSSGDQKSHTKANSNEGAGGGKKQQRHH